MNKRSENRITKGSQGKSKKVRQDPITDYRPKPKPAENENGDIVNARSRSGQRITVKNKGRTEREDGTFKGSFFTARKAA